ncbi:matrix metalloproteinase-20 isoform X2 [Octopus bimaculoides]|uniref:matrix metalloproteinase-20 isoform X2 n=1 Tax=Octopus bimaculoides TaxID=37653 RepID=UPI00071DCBD5|nr:matrix metalloproteinase-20 isoform X2 [Octopus bimaculoides]|eukprot:XP_014785210.1 PREDICTED: matrix metalloproteinase-20-like isoform X2 [Octopus bimaculoides]
MKKRKQPRQTKALVFSKMRSLLVALLIFSFLQIIRTEWPRNAFQATNYLIRYGYLTPDYTLNDPKIAYIKAMKRFQMRANLEITGKLDRFTIKQMQKKRCGVFDMIPSRREPIQFRISKRFALQGSRWLYTNLTYNIKTYTSDLTKQQVDDTIEEAFQIWSRASMLRFTRIYEGTADIEVEFCIGDHNDGVPFDGPGNTLAHAFFPNNITDLLSGNVHFDDDEKWVLGDENGKPVSTKELITDKNPKTTIPMTTQETASYVKTTYTTLSPEEEDLCDVSVNALTVAMDDKLLIFTDKKVAYWSKGRLITEQIEDIFPKGPNSIDAAFTINLSSEDSDGKLSFTILIKLDKAWKYYYDFQKRRFNLAPDYPKKNWYKCCYRVCDEIQAAISINNVVFLFTGHTYEEIKYNPMDDSFVSVTKVSVDSLPMLSLLPISWVIGAAAYQPNSIVHIIAEGRLYTITINDDLFPSKVTSEFSLSALFRCNNTEMQFLRFDGSVKECWFYHDNSFDDHDKGKNESHTYTTFNTPYHQPGNKPDHNSQHEHHHKHHHIPHHKSHHKVHHKPHHKVHHKSHHKAHHKPHHKHHVFKKNHKHYKKNHKTHRRHFRKNKKNTYYGV